MKRNTITMTKHTGPKQVTQTFQHTTRSAKPRWLKATVLYRSAYHLAAGLDLACHLQLHGHAHLCYFARYTSPPFRLEYQLLTSDSLAVLRKTIMRYTRANVSPIGVTFEKCNGSTAHAYGHQAVQALAGTHQLTADAMMDLVHWQFNMAGFSYIQEAALMSAQSYTALRNIPGWSQEPIFGQAKATAKAKARHKRH